MKIIEWDESISVGIEEIDEQHQRLISTIKKLLNSIQSGKSQNALNIILEELIDYIDFHFKTELKVFQLTDYPEADNHKKEYSNFVRKVTKLKRDYEAGSIELATEMMAFLSDWARNHMKKEDKKYADFIAKQRQIMQ